MDKEHDLQSATEDSFGDVGGQHAPAMDRILRLQHSRLGANIALLEQRSEALPSPARFTQRKQRRQPPAARRQFVRSEGTGLLDLIARHTRLFTDVETLIRRAAGGRRAELILNQVRRNHEEMASMLTALLREDETVERLSNVPNASAGGTARAQENWDNEGGHRVS